MTTTEHSRAAVPTGPRRWLKRLGLGIVLLGLVLVLAAAGIWTWLTRTASGASFALSQAQAVLDDLQWSSVSGSLRDGLVLSELRIAQAGSQVTMENVELTAHIRLLGGVALTIEDLTLREVIVRLPPSEPHGEADPPLVMPDLASPIPVTVEALRIEGLTLIGSADELPIASIESLDLAGRYHQSLRLDRFELRAVEGDLSASGQAGLGAPHRLALQLDVTARLDALPEHRIALEATGPLADLSIDLTTVGPLAVQGPIVLRGLPSLDAVDAQLEGQFSDWPELDYAARDLRLSAAGNPDRWQANISTRVEGSAAVVLPDNRILLEASGNLESARLETLRIDTLDGAIQAVGQAQWGDALTAEIQLLLDQLDLTSLYPELPAQARLDGSLNLRLDDQRISLEALALRAPPTTLSVIGTGRYDPTGDDLALDLVWQDFLWPPVTNGDEALIASERGEIKLNGRLSDWRAEIEALLRVPEQAEARIETSLHGSQTGAKIDTLALDAGSAGSARMDGEFSWEPTLQGQLSAELIALDPSEFVRQLPGQVTGQLALTLNSPEDISLSISELGGTLRGQPLSGGGEMNWRTDAPQMGRLELALGENRLTLDSNGGERWDFDIRGDALNQLWPGLSGVLQAQGTLHPEDGELTANASVSNGGWDDITLHGLELNAELRWLEPTRADVVLTLDDLDLNPWERIDTLELTLDGRCRSHAFGLRFSAQRASLDLGGTGQWPDCFRGGERWDAAIDRLFLGDSLAGDWRLSDALEFMIQPGRAALEPACLSAAGPQGGAICLREAIVAAGTQPSNARITLDAVPLDLLLLPLDLTVSLDSRLSGELDGDWTLAAGMDRLSGFMELGAGMITPFGTEQSLLDIDGIRLDLTPADRGVIADLNAQLEGNSSLVGRIDIADLRQPGQSEMVGELRLDLPDISIFNRAVSELDEMQGRLQGRMAIEGVLSQPQFAGEARLISGRIRHAPLGLDIEAINLDLSGNNEQATLSGQMRSGEGQLQLGGTMAPEDDDWRWSLSAQGEQFSLADAPWLSLAVSPTLELSGSGRRMTIDGDLDVDRLAAGLPPGQATRINASEDVVVLGAVEPEQPPSPLVMDGRLGIKLGDDARLSAAGLETRLAGEVELLWSEDELLPRSRGIITLPEGTFESYGQNLEINEGEIILSNHPVTNPRLEIDAVREIFGDPAVEQAGVSIRGNAQNPQIRLFTNPPTSEEKALAYVLTGADFDHAGGQGAVNVGLYLLPKLFVSYGIGLFESGNVLSGRYELSRRWGVRVVSGERDTGVDLSYAVDR